MVANTLGRDTEESAPAEFPPEQPEADVVEDDGATYGADEEEELVEEVEGEPAVKPDKEDADMGGADDTAGPSKEAATKEDDEASDAGSEDLEAESSGSEDEDIEEDEGEGDADEDMEMGDDAEKGANPAASNGHPTEPQHHNDAVMAH